MLSDLLSIGNETAHEISFGQSYNSKIILGFLMTNFYAKLMGFGQSIHLGGNVVAKVSKLAYFAALKTYIHYNSNDWTLLKFRILRVRTFVKKVLLRKAY